MSQLKPSEETLKINSKERKFHLAADIVLGLTLAPAMGLAFGALEALADPFKLLKLNGQEKIEHFSDSIYLSGNLVGYYAGVYGALRFISENPSNWRRYLVLALPAASVVAQTCDYLTRLRKRRNPPKGTRLKDST